jgi:hypothetical protein
VRWNCSNAEIAGYSSAEDLFKTGIEQKLYGLMV